MKIRRVTTGLAITLMLTGLAIAKDTPEQKREKSRKMAAQTLEDLYKLQPTAKAAVGAAAGYAVFNNLGTNLLVFTLFRASAILFCCPSSNLICWPHRSRRNPFMKNSNFCTRSVSRKFASRKNKDASARFSSFK
jgi:hypothetical protein